LQHVVSKLLNKHARIPKCAFICTIKSSQFHWKLSKPRFTLAMRQPCGHRTQAYGPLKQMEWFTHTAGAGRCRRPAALPIAVWRPCGARKCLMGHCKALDGSHMRCGSRAVCLFWNLVFLHLFFFSQLFNY